MPVGKASSLHGHHFVECGTEHRGKMDSVLNSDHQCMNETMLRYGLPSTVLFLRTLASSDLSSDLFGESSPIVSGKLSRRLRWALQWYLHPRWLATRCTYQVILEIYSTVEKMKDTPLERTNALDAFNVLVAFVRSPISSHPR